MSSHNDTFAASGTSPTEVSSQRQPDFLLENHLSIYLLKPVSNAAKFWLEEHIGRDNGFQPYWPTVVIEPRYVTQIIEAIRADMLVCR